MSDQVVRSLQGRDVWLTEAEAEGEGAGSKVALTVVCRGDVPGVAESYATSRLQRVIEHLDEPVLFARVKLTMEPDPARERPAIVEVELDVDGELVRAHIAGREMREAIDLVQRRLRDKLEHRAQRRGALRKRAGLPVPGEWRHGDLPTARPAWFDRPVDEREVMRRTTFTGAELTADEAVFDMEQADFDFFLFTEMATEEDAVVEREADGTYALRRLHPTTVDPGPIAIEVRVVEGAAPELSVDQAVEQLDAGGHRHLFFADEATGRGSVLYRRYDGHYGLLTLG
jgi:ribosome-associated translation inhibitor RaiA